MSTLALLSLAACIRLSAGDIVDLRGAGASFPSPVYTRWTSNYKSLRQDHVALNVAYDVIGSGAGKKKILDNPDSLEYAGSDSFIADEDYEENPTLQMYPVIAGKPDQMTQLVHLVVRKSMPGRLSVKP
ncbi:hypothetical protein CAPTEDRAFT_204462 [Capitella teleta]|uniref:PBP domain-containing protein n=1 Tax=Capitella teleta TaxID=283909 RepID=R7V867_CAPTE|nr:hypothetical protein CAPTEDRAFT_204462 [Capitella teleta]|eukprot:ELU14719.1 hypothetical protein CAPTEDRAFT_204462 [Capitella teleta]